VFSDAELAYPPKASIDSAGMTHAVPLGWHHNSGLDTIDIGCRDFAPKEEAPQRAAQPAGALVIDDVLPPWRPRCMMIRGTAEALTAAKVHAVSQWALLGQPQRHDDRAG
jgi:pyridoxamine 5'-phosphate oxidase family protein